MAQSQRAVPYCHIQSAAALRIIPYDDTSAALLSFAGSLFFRCHGTDNNRFLNRSKGLVIPDHNTRGGIDRFVIIPDNSQALMPCHVGVVAFNFIPHADDQVRSTVTCYAMVSGNSTGIPIRDTVIVTKYILPVTVCHRVSFADNPNVFAVFNGVFLADNHVILFLADFIVYSDNCRVSCIGYRIGRFRIFYYYIINSPRDGRGQQKSCQCRCQRVFRDSYPPHFFSLSPQFLKRRHNCSSLDSK